MEATHVLLQEKKHRGFWAEIWFRLKKNKMVIVALVILSIFVLASLISWFATQTGIGARLFEGTLFGYDRVIGQNMSRPLEMPSGEFWLGTDPFGRDTLARIIYGARISLFIGLATVATSVVLGGILGSIAGYKGGKVDNVIMRLMDVFMAVPSILLAIAIVSALGSDLRNLVFAIAIPAIPGFARITRASIMSVRDQEFVEAADAIGASSMRTVLRHIIPNSMAPLIVRATLSVASAILSTAGLSFIGLGIQPPTPEWGNMLSEGRMFITTDPFYSMVTGITIVIVILALNILGDGLRDALDPKLKQ